ncbi:alpha/beta hydrolase [bacterium]|nr:alpha/beta hydrolase [bacterium]
MQSTRAMFSLMATMCIIASPALSQDVGKDQYFDSNGVRIRYVEQGEGIPVILLHGFLASVEINWRMTRVMPALAKDFRVIAMDHRAHGKSQGPHDPDQYGSEMVEDVVRLMDHLKLPRAHVIGYSMGSVITQELIENHPDRLLSATLGGFGWVDKSGLNFADELAKSVEEGRGFGPIIRFLTPTDETPLSEEQMLRQSQVRLMGTDAQAVVACIRGFKEFSVPEKVFRETKVPLQLVVGDKDPLLQSALEIKRVRPEVRLVEIKDSNHRSTVLRPEFINALKEFLASNSLYDKVTAP